MDSSNENVSVFVNREKTITEMRQIAHKWFDSLWKSRQMTRKEAYRWLQRKMNISAKECHISLFNIEQCNRVFKYALLKRNQKRGELPVIVMKPKPYFSSKSVK